MGLKCNNRSWTPLVRCCRMDMQRWLCFLLLVLLTSRNNAVQAEFPCTQDEACQQLLNKPYATCNTEAGLCANPYYEGGGCLATRLGSNWTRGVRVCNSQDEMPETLDKGYCRLSPLKYAEVRLEIQNWDSATFITYLMQILLSELLDVPTSLESHVLESQGNFYNPVLNKQFGWSGDWSAAQHSLNASSIHHDCVPISLSNTAADNTAADYTPCAHVIAEQWDAFDYAPFLIDAGIIEQPLPVGELAREGWYIPLRTVQHDGSLLHWTGLMAEDNRHKLAGTFKRPVSFRDYCEEVSPTNCTLPDGVATRYPQHLANWSATVLYSKHWYQEELWRYFVPDVYTGYFRYTEQNNCTLHPNTCTGHIVNYPCGWDSYLESQTFHLNIALESNGPVMPIGGYAPEQMPDIWRAANATNNHVIMLYYEPDGFMLEFDGGDYSFQRVTLPPTTQTCIDTRRSSLLICSENKTERIGLDPNGACDDPPQALQKVFSTALYKITKGAHIHEALQSPAYDALRMFSISDLRMAEIFKILFQWDNPTTRKEFGLRDSVCTWLVDNVHVLQGFVPPTHPRVVQESHTQLHTDPLNTASLTLSFVALSGIIVVAGAVYMNRNKNAIKRAQISFLFLLLAGLLCVALGSIADSLPTGNGLCVASVWLTNFGYSLELVPLVVKLAALNRLMQAGQRFRRIKVHTRTLYQCSAFIGLIVLVFLAVWTGIDPPLEQGFYTLSEDMTADANATVVYESFECKSNWMYWWVICIAWQTNLLLTAAVIAFQNRDFREDLVETRTLAMMIYSHLLFVALRAASFVVQQSSTLTDPLLTVHARSIFQSTDTIATLLIYFLPKFLASNNQQGSTQHLSASSHYIAGLRAAATIAAANHARTNATDAATNRASLPAVVWRSREFFRRSKVSRSSSSNKRSSSKMESSGVQHGSAVEDGWGSAAEGTQERVESLSPSPVADATEPFYPTDSVNSGLGSSSLTKAG